MKNWEAAELVLRNHGEPMHYKNITESAIDNGWIAPDPNAPTPEATLRTEMSKRPHVFQNVQKGSGMYALTEWGLPTPPVDPKTKKSKSPGGRDAKPTPKDTISNHTEIKLPERFVLKPQFFVVLVATQDNLNICRQYQVAGLPDSDSGRWAFLDIDEGDYISFYNDYHLYDLYVVEHKYIPPYPSRSSSQDDGYDPVPVEESVYWRAQKGYRFPYRMKLRRIKGADTNTRIIFKPEFTYLGANLFPRTSQGKSHFQVPFGQISQIFDVQTPLQSARPIKTLEWFCECAKRAREKSGSPVGALKDGFAHEMHLQAYAKKMIEQLWRFLAPIFGMDADAAFLSEQAVLGGKIDIMVLTAESTLLLEVKRNPIFSRRGVDPDNLRKDGRDAKEQVMKYRPFHSEGKIVRAILGISDRADGKLRIAKTKDGIYAIEIDDGTPFPNNQ